MDGGIRNTVPTETLTGIVNPPCKKNTKLTRSKVISSKSWCREHKGVNSEKHAIVKMKIRDKQLPNNYFNKEKLESHTQREPMIFFSWDWNLRREVIERELKSCW